MNKIINIAVLALLAGGLSSCEGFLKENPKSALTSASFNQTEDQITEEVNYLYWNGAPRDMSNAGSAYVGPVETYDGMLTGYFTNDYEGQQITCKYARTLTRQQYTSQISGDMDGLWDDCYRAINVANSIIKYAPDVPMDETSKATLIGEAKFFRAFNYYYLVKTFGDVPLTLEPYESEANMMLQRTAAATIYQTVEADLKDAVAALPALKFAANGHRITKYAAAMLLATVYMHEGKYSDAVEPARTVINSPHSLTKNDDLTTGSAFNKLRTTDDLDEVIYAQEFNASIQDGSWWPTYAFDQSAVSLFGTYSIFTKVYGPTDQFINVYEKNDLRVQPNQFFQWNYTNPDNGKTWSSKSACAWYWYDEDALLNTGKATKDFNFFRYAEALLDGAESIAQSEGVTAEAAGYLAQVQARADMSGKTVAEYTADLQKLSKDDFIHACWTERLREFPLEFKIWDDCTRTGMFPEISKTTPGQVNYVPLVGATNGAGAIFQQSDLLWPISVNEMQRNPNLTQNPGYQTN
jgi:hypothetical protein